jgi:hypothetical protein
MPELAARRRGDQDNGMTHRAIRLGRAATVFGLIAVSANAADDRPAVTRPVTDMVVTYVLKQQEPGNAGKMVVTYADSGQRIRVDSFIFPNGTVPYEGFIYDGKNGKIIALGYSQRIAIENTAKGLTISGITVADDMRFQRLGTGRYAGLDCDSFKITNAQASDSGICITPDGVVVHSVMPKTDIEAVEVRHGPVDATAFTIPADLRRVTVPPPDSQTAAPAQAPSPVNSKP